MQDIAGCRVEVEDLDAQDLAVAAILKRFPQGLVYDRRLKPSHGYRSVHIVVVASDCAVEIQVRTALQHGWASTVERLSDRLDPDIKYGGGPEALRLHLLTWSKIIEQVEALAERGRLLRQGQASGSEIDALEVQMGRLQADLKQALVRIILLEEDAAAKS